MPTPVPVLRTLQNMGVVQGQVVKVDVIDLVNNINPHLKIGNGVHSSDNHGGAELF